MKLRKISGGLVIEASLSRMMGLAKRGQFAILTAYRGEFSERQNLQRNRQLLTRLNVIKMGVHQLIGHWQECSDPTLSWDQCDPSLKRDVVERSFFVYNSTRDPQFEQIMRELCVEFEQDGMLIGSEGVTDLVITKSGEHIPLGGLTLGKVSQAYSQHIRKRSVPFVFEGLEMPANNIERLLWSKIGLQVPASYD